MNDKNLVSTIVMLILMLIGFVTVVATLFNACSSMVHAQEAPQQNVKSYNNFDVHYSEFSMKATAGTTKETCLKLHGRWTPLGKQALPQKPVRITSGALCYFDKQVLLTDPQDGSVVFDIPRYAVFVFDHVGEVEFAIFWYDFETWSSMDFAKRSMQKHVRDYFIFGVKKIEEGSYKLTNTPFYLSYRNYDNNRLGITISREQFSIYEQD